MHNLKPIPECANIEFKEKFVHRYSQITDWQVFKTYCCSFLRKSIRVNTLKISIEDLKKRLEKSFVLEQIPWCKEGFWIRHKQDRLDVGNTAEHVLGYYYVQESASMIPPIVLDPQPGERILDMCAAPGSKTSQIAQYMENEGIIVANDVKGLRLAPLGINVQRMGVSNCVLTLMKGEGIQGVEFDKVLLDAPCSGTGTIRKSIKTIAIWNPEMIKRLASVQRRLITKAFELVAPGGRLVYSTCSVEPEEDEAVVDFLLQTQPFARIEEINLPIVHTPAITEFEGKIYNSEVKKCLRLWPQDNDTEGFFVASIKKVE